MALPSCTTNVKQMPRNVFTVDVNIKNVFHNAHCLNSGMQDIV